ncbi:MAG: hypothetical protein PSX71_03420 [bacterium]|nr:hypothetical protein [bacterium]
MKTSKKMISGVQDHEIYDALGTDFFIKWDQEKWPVAPPEMAPDFESYCSLSLLMDRITSGNGPAFFEEYQERHRDYRATSIGMMMQKMGDFISSRRQFARLSEKLQLFFEGADHMGLYINQDLRVDANWQPPELNYHRYNLLVNFLRERSHQPSFLKMEKARKERSDRRIKDSLTYIRKLFSQNQRLYVIRMDFGHYVDTWVAEDAASLALLQADLSKFINRISKRLQPFQYLVGHICSLEYGPYKGPYGHILFFFDEGFATREYMIVSAVTQCWRQVVAKNSGKTGVCINCRENGSSLRKEGRGLISLNDKQLFQELVREICYTARMPEALGLASHKGKKTYNLGRAVAR